MQQQSVDLNSRRKRIRLTVKALADEAGVDRATVHRAIRGGNVTLATNSKIEEALARAERRLVGDLLLDASRRPAAPVAHWGGSSS